MSGGPKRTLRWIVFGILALGSAGLVLFLGTTRFIHAEEALYRVPKKSFGFSQTYVDTREWGPLEFADDPQIGKQLLRARMEAAVDTAQEAVDEMGDALKSLGKSK